jgi:hypothetical protein
MNPANILTSISILSQIVSSLWILWLMFFYAFIISPICSTCYAQLKLLDLSIRVIFGEANTLRSFFQASVSLFPPSPYKLPFPAPCFQTPSNCVLPFGWETSCKHIKATDKIIVLYILTLTFWDSNWEGRYLSAEHIPRVSQEKENCIFNTHFSNLMNPRHLIYCSITKFLKVNNNPAIRLIPLLNSY